MSNIGRYITQPTGYKAFTPYPFPPKESIVLSPKLSKKLENAVRLIGKLDGIARLLPDKDFFLLMFIKKDATTSSQIEGTRATFQDAVAFEVTEEKSQLSPDVDDIFHYVYAVNYAIERIKDFPLSLRMILEIHEKLMQGARATQNAFPGNFRTTQNWIGASQLKDATFVPPPPHDMQESLRYLEDFIHAEDDYSIIIKAALIHAQFETIHPFADGNGRTGRILIAMYLHHAGILDLPVLYLSTFFKKNRKLYYNKLADYHDTSSGVNEWINFFLDGIIETASSSIAACDRIVSIRERDFAKIQTLGVVTAGKTLEVLKKLFCQPIVGISEIMKWTEYTPPGAYKMIERLVGLGILKPLDEDSKYGKKYVYADYYEIFDEDFEQKNKLPS